MKPGQGSVTFGALVADHGGLQGQGALSAEVPFTDSWSATARVAGMYGTGFQTRDSSLGVRWRAVEKPTFSLSISPTLSLPTGSIGANLAYTPLSTGSVDPRLQVDFVAGGTWLVAGTLVGRVPLYNGFDGNRQGAYGYADARLARRFGAPVIPFLGASYAGAGAPDVFHEVSAVGGLVWAPTDTLAVSAMGRVPYSTHYTWAAGASVSKVFGEKPDHHD